MLLKLLSNYLNQVEQAIVQCQNAYVERYQEEILTSQRANLRIRLRFSQTHLLEINEAIVITDNHLEFLDYRYHFQDEKNNLVFRYDSAIADLVGWVEERNPKLTSLSVYYGFGE